MINVMEEYGTIKRLKFLNNTHINNGKTLICFETKEQAQRAIADINQYPGWKASLYYTEKYRKINKRVQVIQIIQQVIQIQNEGRYKKANENQTNQESKRNKTNSESKIIKVEKE